MRESEADGSELDKAEVARRGLGVVRGHATRVLDPTDALLDAVA